MVGEGRAVRIDRAAAEEVLLEREVAELVEQLDRGCGDLGADPVAGEQCDGRGHEGLSQRDVVTGPVRSRSDS